MGLGIFISAQHIFCLRGSGVGVPLSLSRRIGSTTIASAFGLACVVYVCFMTMLYSPCTAAKTDFAKLIRPVGIFQIFAAFPILLVRVSTMAFAFGNRQPDGSREMRWRVFIVICMLLVSVGCSAALGSNLALPIAIAGLLGGNTLGFFLTFFFFVFPFTLYLKHYGLKNDKPLYSMIVLVSLVFCCLLYPICLVGIFNPSNF
jgi:hypothetical protein